MVYVYVSVGLPNICSTKSQVLNEWIDPTAIGIYVNFLRRFSTTSIRHCQVRWLLVSFKLLEGLPGIGIAIDVGFVSYILYLPGLCLRYVFPFSGWLSSYAGGTSLLSTALDSVTPESGVNASGRGLWHAMLNVVRKQGRVNVF